MKITLQQYDRAKAAVVKLARHQATVDAWESAVQSVGSMGDMKIVAVKIVDGKVTVECKTAELPPASPSLDSAKSVS